MANWYEVQRSKKGYRFLDCTGRIQDLKDETASDTAENAPAEFCGNTTQENVA
ncbi:MAG: hypothetical protein IJR51_06235 [Clostridia bacterium]|nr:hypothetical protein [Clostridia bacterium]MBQ9506737.1 hypothetical protein [Clostridia bacterium]MBR5424394.1 hypothetical protein [Clostridia bacterium]